MRTPDPEAWAAWRPEELLRRLGGLTRPWSVVGGWALDLWRGCETRPHEDLEFAVLRPDFRLFREALAECEAWTAHAGELAFSPEGAEPAPHAAQVWLYDRAAGFWRVDLMIEPGTPETWIYKRDPSIRRPRAETILRDDRGIPHLAPAAALLFKAKHRRPKDEADFAMAAPLLPELERRWLKSCLERLHPGHGWIAALRGEGEGIR